jgi:hypothetical protein
MTAAGYAPGSEPVRRCGELIGLYLQSRELHFRVAVHESSHPGTDPPGAVSTCLCTARRLSSAPSARVRDHWEALRLVPYPPLCLMIAAPGAER